ncbi:MAG: hypothetical protein ACR2KT_01205 [Methylocella sp.]
MLEASPVLRINLTKMFHVKHFGKIAGAQVLMASYSEWLEKSAIAPGWDLR